MAQWLKLFCYLLLGLSLSEVQYEDFPIENKINSKVEDLNVVKSDGSVVNLSGLAGGRALVLVPVYYECPSICGVMVKEILGFVGKSRFVAGKDYSLAFFSFDETETFELAREKREAFLNEVDKNGLDVEFLTASHEVINKLTEQIGFKFVRRGKDFDHPPAIYVLDKDLKISSAFKTLLIDHESLDLSIVNASAGRIGTFLDQVTLICSSFDPRKGKYTLSVLKIVRLVGIVTVLMLGTVLFVLWKNEKRSKS